jgi:hypothetical protein
MDNAYYSVHPCRPNGVPSDCCVWDIEQDWQERKPLSVDCRAMHTQGKQLFEIEGGCPKDKAGRHLNHLCLEAGGVNKAVSAKSLSLWTHYGASGPFTNSKGQPLDGLPMKCVCYGLHGGASSSSVDYFIVRNLGPSQCGKARRGLIPSRRRPLQSIPCDGSFVLKNNTVPPTNLLKRYADEGYNVDTLRRILKREEQTWTVRALPLIPKLMIEYANRTGYTSWPSVNKFPFNVAGIDSCKEKGVVPVPFPLLSFPAYTAAVDPTISNALSILGLCAPYSLTQYFCPSFQNARLQPVIRWNIDDPNKPYGIFADGTRWNAMGLIECTIKCKISPIGTSYIGEGPYGIVV